MDQEQFFLIWYINMASIGIIANTLMFAVFCGPSLRKHSVSVYFRAMSMSDVVMNIFFFTFVYEYASGLDLKSTSDFSCKFLAFLLFFMTPLSAWYLVAAGLDRFLTIVFPTKFLFIKKPRFSVSLCFLILVYSFAYNFYLFFNFDFVTLNRTKNAENSTYFVINSYCVFKNVKLFSTADFINTCLLPFVIMVTSTIATTIGVLTTHRRMKKFVQAQQLRKTQLRDIKFGVSMIILNLVFLVLKIPNILIFISNSLDLNTLFSGNFVIINYVVEIIFSLLYTINFFLQLASNSLVRKQFVRLFCLFVLKTNERHTNISEV